jgi:hypothetical protein
MQRTVGAPRTWCFAPPAGEAQRSPDRRRGGGMVRLSSLIAGLILVCVTAWAKDVQLLDENDLLCHPTFAPVKLLSARHADEIEPYMVSTDVDRGPYAGAWDNPELVAEVPQGRREDGHIAGCCQKVGGRELGYGLARPHGMRRGPVLRPRRAPFPRRRCAKSPTRCPLSESHSELSRGPSRAGERPPAQTAPARRRRPATSDWDHL